MKVMSLRLNEDEQQKLSHLSAKTGYTFSELIRYLIDNLDENNLELALNKDNENDKKNRKVNQDLTAELHYKNWLFSNVTNNVNQIAKWLNSQNSDEVFTFNNQKILLNAFQTVEKRLEEIEEKIDGKNGNN